MTALSHCPQRLIRLAHDFCPRYFVWFPSRRSNGNSTALSCTLVLGPILLTLSIFKGLNFTQPRSEFDAGDSTPPNDRHTRIYSPPLKTSQERKSTTCKICSPNTLKNGALQSQKTFCRHGEKECALRGKARKGETLQSGRICVPNACHKLARARQA